MAQIPVLTGDHLKVVPDFRGEVELLPEFISISEKLVNHFYNPEQPDVFQNIYLMSSLKSKIQGDARINISSYTINTWQDLKNALLSTYSDKRDAYTLTIEMCNLTQGGDTPFEFHNKIQKLVNLHNSYLDTHDLDHDHVKEYISKLALRTLLKGLKEPLGSLMRTKDPEDMGDALNMLTNDFQIDTVKKPQSSQSSSIKHKPSFILSNNNWRQNQPRPFIPFRPNPQISRPNYSNFPQNKPIYNFDPNRYNNAGPSQNRNTNLNSTYQNQPHSNPNNFRPQNRPLPRPTPMSGVQTIRNNNLHTLETNHQYEDSTLESQYDHENTYYDQDKTNGNSTDDYQPPEDLVNFCQEASETPENIQDYLQNHQ